VSPLYRNYDFRPSVRKERAPLSFGRGAGGKKRGDKKELKAKIMTAGAAALLALVIAVVVIIAWVSFTLPDPNKLGDRNVAQTTRIYDRTGKVVLYEVFSEQKRTIVELDQISDYVKKGTIAAEDKGFYEHGGFDVVGMIRATRNNILNIGGPLQSGSTITQQFIKKSILTDEQTYTRKFKELILAIEIERRYTKDEILKLYLNEIPYGAVSYGIESASQSFLGKSAKDLTLSEASLLVSLPKGPTYYSPYGSHTDRLTARQHYVLDAMVEHGDVTKEEADEAKKDDVLARIKPKRDSITAPHFVFYVKELLAEQFGENAMERGGLKVITTLDANRQADAEKSVEDGMKAVQQYNGNSAALLSLDAKTGDILAMVGSADYFNDEIDGKVNALVSNLQPGSSIKPMVYAAAFEKGYTPNTVVYDVKTTFKNDPTDYEPQNYDGGERGPVTLKTALAGSLNIPAVKTLYLLGIDRFIEFSTRVGYTTFERKNVGLSLVLGGAEVRPIEHIAAFTAFARDGEFHPARALLRVEDAKGTVLYDVADQEDTGKKAFDAQVARQMNDILSDNAARAYVFGENNHLNVPGRQTAAKTGTTNRFKDAWTVGYTPSVVTGVWVGHSRGTVMKSGADGSKIAAPIWNSYMRKALADSPAEGFTPPDAVATGKPILDGDKNAQAKVKVDKASGKLATEFTPEDYIEERYFGTPHSILFFVDKDDPRGPVPENPQNDPQFENWEKGVAEWVAKQPDIIITEAPTEYDDVHRPEYAPTVSFITPSEGGTISERTFIPSVSASAPRGVAKIVYSMDDQEIGTTTTWGREPITVPNRFGKGFHTLTATAHDGVGNRSFSKITVNLLAEPGPLGIEWKDLWQQKTVYTSDFPLQISFAIADPASIEVLSLVARGEGSGADEIIGSIEKPPLPGMSFTWNTAPPTGTYLLTANVKLTTGERVSEMITIYVR